MIIAVDGPAAAGKGTLARRLAKEFNLAYLDTGALYRAVALQLLRLGLAYEEAEIKVEDAAHASLHLDIELLSSAEIRGESVGQMASKVAAMPAVRANLLDFQRRFANDPSAFVAGNFAGAVLDGRDIGTVVCPDADIKLYVTASPEERARRRFLEMKERGGDVKEEKVLADVLSRDERDRSRAAAPMKPAEDAYLLDTTKLDIEAAFDQAAQLVRAHI